VIKKNTIVSKFGGSSMASFEVMQRAAIIIERERSSFIVVSAVYQTTDQLIYLIQQAQQKNWSECVKKIFSLKEKHFDITSSLKSVNEVNAILKDYFLELETILHGITLLGECTPQAYDRILAFGEQLSSTIFFYILKEQYPNKNIELVKAQELIKTDDYFNEAEPLINEISKNLKRLNLKDTTYLTQGFIGSTLDNKTTTLGRGGSDYSAALIAEALNADLLQVWTDIDGINTTDPRICESSKRIEEITYDEASEFAYLGAKILHPITLLPTKRADIPVYIGSTLLENSLGTKILTTPSDSPVVRGLSSLSGMVKVVLSNNSQFKQHEFLIQSTEVLSKNKIDLMGLNITEKNICFYVKEDKIEDLKRNKSLKKLSSIKVEENLSLISIIGNDLTKNKIVNLVKDQNDILTIIHGASEHSITMSCKASDEKIIINELHKRFCK
jgi:aspartate kinase